MGRGFLTIYLGSRNKGFLVFIQMITSPNEKSAKWGLLQLGFVLGLIEK
jgi:hypothetical protein